MKNILKLLWIFCVLLPLEYVAPDYCRKRRERNLSRTAREHLGTCQTCPTYDAPVCSRSRGGCGCNMPLKLEKYPLAKCPRGKW